MGDAVDAFGTLAFGTPATPFGYSGQYVDGTTGLVNDRARWYEPQSGGFTTRDPDFSATDTAYSYAGDDPVNESDPTGLDPGSGTCSAIAAANGNGATPPSSGETAALNAAGCSESYLAPPCPSGSIFSGIGNFFNQVGNGLASIGQNLGANAGNLAQIVAGGIVTVVGGGLCVAGSGVLDIGTAGIGLLLTPEEAVACGAIGSAGVGLSIHGIRGWQSTNSGSTSGGGSDDEFEPVPGVGGAAANYDAEELAQLTYQHTGEGDIPGRPTLSEIQTALAKGTPESLPGQNSVQFEYGGVRVIINEDIPTRSTAYYPGQ